MAEQGLRAYDSSYPGIAIMGHGLVVQIVQNTIVYLIKDKRRGEAVIRTSDLMNTNDKPHLFGITLVDASRDLFHVYIDTLTQADRKGLISQKRFLRRLRRTRKILLTVALILVIMLFLSFPPFVLLASGAAIVLYPIQHLVERAKFKRKQRLIEMIGASFESEFAIESRKSTNDSLTFWGKVKSDGFSVLEDHL
jgi:hypothetical protein